MYKLMISGEYISFCHAPNLNFAIAYGILPLPTMAFAMSPSKPTAMFVHGTFYTLDHLKPLGDLRQSSYPSMTLSLPSIGDNAATFSPGDDIRAVRTELDRSIENWDKDVVLTMHSYEGVPGS